MLVDLATTVAMPAEQVFALLCSEEFQADKARLVAARDFEMATWTEGEHLCVQTVRRMSAAALPEFVKALVDPVLVVTETERWAEMSGARYAGEFTVAVKGAPVRFEGQVEIVAVGSRSRVRYWGEMIADVPLFRRQVAEAAAGAVKSTIVAEFALLDGHEAPVSQAKSG